MNDLIGTKLRVVAKNDGSYRIEFSNTPGYPQGATITHDELTTLSRNGVLYELHNNNPSKNPLLFG